MAARTGVDHVPVDSVESLLADIAAKGKAPNDEGNRESIMASARALVAALQTPMEAVTWMIWAQPTRNAAIRIAIDLGIFEKLIQDGAIPKDAADLAPQADSVLVTRIVKHLASMGVVKEVGMNRYGPTSLAETLAIPRYRDAIVYCFDRPGPVFQKLPEFLAPAYKNPEDTCKGPYQYAHNTDEHCWTWMMKRQNIMQAFMNYSGSYRADKPSWTDIYPVTERLVKGLARNKDSASIVDVGGGNGQDLQDFIAKYPTFEGHLVLQDQPQVIAQLKELDSRIVLAAHDFFTPQPIVGARAYYMHYVLHDWPDEQCRKILQQLKNAMEPGYSRLLINENVIPNTEASWQHTSLDIIMMALTAGQERTEAQWRKLLKSVGLQITGLWTKGIGNETLMEIEVDEAS